MILLNQQKKKTKEHISTPNKKRIKKKPTNKCKPILLYTYVFIIKNKKKK